MRLMRILSTFQFILSIILAAMALVMRMQGKLDITAYLAAGIAALWAIWMQLVANKMERQ